MVTCCWDKKLLLRQGAYLVPNQEHIFETVTGLTILSCTTSAHSAHAKGRITGVTCGSKSGQK